MKKSIASVNSDSLTGGDDDDIALNDQCTRLLCLVVIYYNSYILSEVLKAKSEKASDKDLEAFKHISLISWSHINFHGYYNFSSGFSEDALKEMIQSILLDHE